MVGLYYRQKRLVNGSYSDRGGEEPFGSRRSPLVLVAALARHLPRYLLHVAPAELAERMTIDLSIAGYSKQSYRPLLDRKTIFPPSCLHDRTSPGSNPGRQGEIKLSTFPRKKAAQTSLGGFCLA